MDTRLMAQLFKLGIAAASIYFLGSFMLAKDAGSVLPYCVIALISAYYHRDLTTKIYQVFSSYPRPAIISAFYLTLFAAVLLTNVEGTVGIAFRVLAAVVAWLAGAYTIKAVGYL